MIIVLIGPMGCGKTTIGKLLAQKLHCDFEDGDDFHPRANVEKMKAGVPLSDSDRFPWLEIIHNRMQRAIIDRKHLIVACSALKKIYRKKLGIDQKSVFSVYLKGTPELLQKRVSGRTHQYMSNNLLNSQLETLEPPEDGLSVDIIASPELIIEEIISQTVLKKNHRGTPNDQLS